MTERYALEKDGMIYTFSIADIDTTNASDGYITVHLGGFGAGTPSGKSDERKIVQAP